MRATEFLTESQHQEIQYLQEGPFGSLVKAAGTGIGKLAGGLAKGAGAVAGGVAGMGSAFKKGYQAGKKTVAAAGDDPEDNASTNTAASNTGSAPAAQQTAPAATTSAPAAQSAAQPAATTSAPPATSNSKSTPQAGTAAPKDTAYSKTLKAVNSLSGEQKKELIAMLQQDPKVVSAMNRPTKSKGTTKSKASNEPDDDFPDIGKDASPDADSNTDSQKGLSPGDFGKMAQDLIQPGKEKTADPQKAKTNSSKQSADATARGQQNKGFGFNNQTGVAFKSQAEKDAFKAKKAQAGAPTTAAPTTAAPTTAASTTTAPTTAASKKSGGKVAGQLSQTPDAVRKREARAKAKTQKQAEIDADRDRVMGTTSDSIIRKQPSLIEGFSIFRR